MSFPGLLDRSDPMTTLHTAVQSCKDLSQVSAGQLLQRIAESLPMVQWDGNQFP